LFISISDKTSAKPSVGVKTVRKRLYFEELMAVIMGLSRRSKQFIVFAIDAFSILFTVWLSFSLRYEMVHIPHNFEWYLYISALAIALPVFVKAGLYRAIFRYSGFAALTTVAKACLQYGIFYFIVIILFFPPGISRSIGIIQPLLLLIAIGSSRAMARFWLHPGSESLSVSCTREKLLIYGSGSAGVQIASAFQHNTNYAVAGFIDDDHSLIGKSINGITVYSLKAVPFLVQSIGIRSILIAIPSASRARRQEIYRLLEGLGVHIRTLPGIEALADGKVDISDIREIDIEDLLGRDPVAPYPELFARCIRKKTVLVTGAGGSIGSELCRQILMQTPDRLILLEQSEFNLYVLHQELDQRIHAQGHSSKIIPVLGDVTDKRFMDRVFALYCPHTVYHAAAYKHVPLVESNPGEGLRNNVFGTLTIAEAAKNSGAEHVILVSSDKAVRPTNIMGASKRISELILQAIAAEQNGTGTCFSMVRFGNVLGSSGSVVPLFRNQIRNGGPVTVTHKDVTRYFMTIPEAAQLVIQAGAMAEGGDVFLLDMGEPVKIIDLARRMIELSGLTLKDRDNPDADIEIVFTGLRPGEKLYEELLIADNPMPTMHPRIFKAHEYYYPMDKLKKYLDKLSDILKDGDIENLKVLIQTIVIGYQLNGKVNSIPLPEKESTVALS
jgi:FlaA1/EpsC-like NDP-sugar epimerase